jgi:hypothetical protein
MRVLSQHLAEPVAKHDGSRNPIASFLQIVGWRLGGGNQSHWILLRVCIRSDSVREKGAKAKFQA